MNRKDRRHSGRVTPRTTLELKYKEIIQQALEPQEYWDDWIDYRDGLRSCKLGKTKIYHFPKTYGDIIAKKYYYKNKRLLKRRKARKEKLRNPWFRWNYESLLAR